MCLLYHMSPPLSIREKIYLGLNSARPLPKAKKSISAKPFKRAQMCHKGLE
jgi:hypothetical protein